MPTITEERVSKLEKKWRAAHDASYETRSFAEVHASTPKLTPDTIPEKYKFLSGVYNPLDLEWVRKFVTMDRMTPEQSRAWVSSRKFRAANKAQDRYIDARNALRSKKFRELALKVKKVDPEVYRLYISTLRAPRVTDRFVGYASDFIPTSRFLDVGIAARRRVAGTQELYEGRILAAARHAGVRHDLFSRYGGNLEARLDAREKMGDAAAPGLQKRVKALGTNRPGAIRVRKNLAALGTGAPSPQHNTAYALKGIGRTRRLSGRELEALAKAGVKPYSQPKRQVAKAKPTARRVR